jgi:kinesin family protein 15
VQEYQDIRKLLDAMETRPPSEARSSLGRLACLSLCADWHQGQIDEVVLKWEKGIKDASVVYGNRLRLRTQKTGLELALAEQENKNGELQAEVDKLRTVSRNQKSLKDLKVDLARALAELQGEKEKSASTTRQMNTALRRSQEQEVRIREYNRITNETKQNAERLEQEKAQALRQLDAEREATRTMKRRYEEATSTASKLNDEITANKLSRERVSLENTQLLKDITRERDDLEMKVDTLEDSIDQLNDESTELKDKMEIAANEAESNKIALSEEITRLLSELEIQHRKYEELTTEVGQLKNKQATLQTENETLRIGLLSEKSKAVQLQQDLEATKQDLSITKLCLAEAQASLEKSEQSNAKLKTSAAKREKALLAEIAVLVGQVDLMKGHPFRTFFRSLIDTFKI